MFFTLIARAVRAMWRADQVIFCILVVALLLAPFAGPGRGALVTVWLILFTTLGVAALAGFRLGVAGLLSRRGRAPLRAELTAVRGGRPQEYGGGAGVAPYGAGDGFEQADAEITWVGQAADAPAGRGLYDLTQEEIDEADAMLRARIRGQNAAVEMFVRALRRRAEGADIDPDQPLTFLLVGPTGAGKTKLVRTLAEALRRLYLPFEMGKMKDKNNNSELWMFFGSPQGYNGGPGKLTSQVDSNPDAVILLDEIEKAEPDLLDAFYSMFDEGGSADLRTNKWVDFRRAIICMTSNLLKDIPEEVFEDPERARALVQATNFFKEEALNRIQCIVPFRRLTAALLKEIARLELEAYVKRICAARRCAPKVFVDSAVLDAVVALVDPKYGARDIKRRLATMIADRVTEGLVQLPYMCPLGRLDIRLHDGQVSVTVQAAGLPADSVYMLAPAGAGAQGHEESAPGGWGGARARELEEDEAALVGSEG